MEKKLIFKITDYIERDLQWEEEECRKAGIGFQYFQLKYASPAEIISHIGDADIVLTNMVKFNSEVFAGLERMKVLLRHGIGYDNVDVDAATRHGVVFANEALASSEDVAEHAMLLMFSVYKKSKLQTVVFDDWVRTKQWSSDKIFPIYRIRGKTIGIVGCGNIGSRVLRRLKGLDVNILVCDPYLSAERRSELGIEHTSLDELLRQSDIVTVHVPVTAETRGMFNLERFNRMKREAVIINTARGPVIRTEDLIRALKEKTIAGAGIDVYEEEPPSADFQLIGMENVVLSPHIAWYSEEGGWDIRHMIMDDVRAFLDGKAPNCVVNPGVWKNPQLKIKLRR